MPRVLRQKLMNRLVLIIRKHKASEVILSSLQKSLKDTGYIAEKLRLPNKFMLGASSEFMINSLLAIVKTANAVS